jgi:hypothetical protein
MGHKQISVSGDAEIEFAKLAMAYFKQHPDKATFTECDVLYDALFAVRWGMGEDCVLVFTVGSDPVIYTP